jgi:hypothetical protein
MPTRHRIPSVFNLSMVDVLCCALGCVILLWLINTRLAREQTRAAGSSRADLKTLQDRHAATLTRLAREQKDRRRLASELVALRTRQASTEASLSQREQENRRRGREIDDLKVEKQRAEASVVRLTREQRNLLRQLAGLKLLHAREKEALRKKTLELGDLEKLLAALKADRASISKRLLDSEGAAKTLRAEAASLRASLTRAEERMLALEKEVQGRDRRLAAAGQDLERTRRQLRRDLEDARASIGTLERDRKRLTAQVVRERSAAAKRFAGISLTGRRVVFLVDRSGSMEMVARKTPAPGKWAEVRRTLARIMRSLPDLEKFQVILFSSKVTYLLGGEGWIDYTGRASVSRVTRALAQVKPARGTNMHAAFAAAFRLRPAGLDTIYVLSDGLPNLGEGLTREQARKLKEHQRCEVLSKYIRSLLRTTWNPPRAGRRVRINTVGFFFESPDVGAFLWALARENDGSFVGMSKP